MPKQIETQSCPTLRTLKKSTIDHADWKECCLTRRDSALIPESRDLNPNALASVRQDVFDCDGPDFQMAKSAALTQLESQEPPTCPTTHLNGLNGGAPGMGGLQLTGITNKNVTPVTVNGQLLGYQAEDAHARYCWLTGLRAENRSLSEGEQTRCVFELMIEALAQAGMTLKNIARTWFFNHRILEWYDEFNQVRSEFFKEHEVFDNVVPASTGVGMPNIHDGALITDAFAVLPLETSASTSVHIQAVPSPLQCPALDYGSSFSRAIEIETPAHRRLMISGTASIEVGGRTAHVGNVQKQIALTMDVVEAILTSRGMSWSNAYRSIAYFKQASDAKYFDAYLKAEGLPELYHVCAEADVCRDDLLFELELEACITKF